MRSFVSSTHFAFLFLIFIFCNGCSSDSSSDTSYLDSDSNSGYKEEVPATVEDNSVKISYTEMYGNTITIPVAINGMTLDMIFDTGASQTCITLAEAKYLYEKGKLAEEDIVDMQQFQTADGNISVGLRIILREISIDNKITLHDTEAIVVQNQQAPLLLGQSVMKQFREISVDRSNKVIKFFQ